MVGVSKPIAMLPRERVVAREVSETPGDSEGPAAGCFSQTVVYEGCGNSPQGSSDAASAMHRLGIRLDINPEPMPRLVKGRIRPERDSMRGAADDHHGRRRDRAALQAPDRPRHD